MLPHLLELAAPRSIVDVGCGIGTWLKAAAELGVRDLAGLDGAYVDRSLLQIPHEQFTAIDLTQPFRVERTFDVALSLEVAEHLPEASAEPFIESLTRLAPVILFSAAIPHQMGAHHINEQWQTWWVERFARAGFIAVDCMRRRVWDDPDVEWWYAQNMLLMAREDYLSASPALQQERDKAATPYAVVHPRAYLIALPLPNNPAPAGWSSGSPWGHRSPQPPSTDGSVEPIRCSRTSLVQSDNGTQRAKLYSSARRNSCDDTENKELMASAWGRAPGGGASECSDLLRHGRRRKLSSERSRCTRACRFSMRGSTTTSSTTRSAPQRDYTMTVVLASDVGSSSWL